MSSGELPLTVVEGNGILKVLRNQEPVWLNGKVVDLVMTDRQKVMGVVIFIEYKGGHWQDGYEPLHAGLTQNCLAACAK